ncbi:hypothetical protein ACHAWF_009064, partial [Thalassiosira exigua]
GLIERVIEALGLDADTTNGKWTPAEQKPLLEDVNGKEAVGNFSYGSVVGMLLYLSEYSRLDIAFAVTCCARYMFCPKKSHELTKGQKLKVKGRAPARLLSSLMPAQLQVRYACSYLFTGSHDVLGSALGDV